MLTIGQIVKPQGIRGEVKVATSDPSRFLALKKVYIRGKRYAISSARTALGAAFVKLDGVDDRTHAESLRGNIVEIERSDAPPLAEGEFYVADITGAKLVARGENGVVELGVISSVRSFGAADVFSAERADGAKFSFPFLKALCPVFDEQERTLEVDGKKLSEVVVYED